jgi:hypothetical protein
MAETKQLASNRKAFHDYEIVERIEAGISLTGTEIKSLRANGASIREAYARPAGGEMWLYGAHIISTSRMAWRRSSSASVEGESNTTSARPSRNATLTAICNERCVISSVRPWCGRPPRYTARDPALRWAYSGTKGLDRDRRI